MPVPPSEIPLTIIVAATRSMGIGAKGNLPWPPLKSEMAYFSRVTKRPPPSRLPPTSLPIEERPVNMNAVIMGRRTWDSIPRRSRPLSGRINIVITRRKELSPANGTEGPYAVGSIQEGLELLSQRFSITSTTALDNQSSPFGRVFVIGGADIYGQALALPATDRILLTKIEAEYQCDTFFPITLDEEVASTWTRQDNATLSTWVGEKLEPAMQEDNGVQFELTLWVKR
ncbi:dihydrofolate reductase [Agyrium rufum]|nr:dihydrofolate reductase [Agyrium rufum]